jgi:hypothetical protein
MSAQFGLCRSASCRQRVLWVTMEKSGKPNPLNPDPDPDRGNVVVDDHYVGHQVGAATAAALREQGVELWLSHFATCPDREQHRAS